MSTVRFRLAAVHRQKLSFSCSHLAYRARQLLARSSNTHRDSKSIFYCVYTRVLCLRLAPLDCLRHCNVIFITKNKTGDETSYGVRRAARATMHAARGVICQHS